MNIYVYDIYIYIYVYICMYICIYVGYLSVVIFIFWMWLVVFLLPFLLPPSCVGVLHFSSGSCALCRLKLHLPGWCCLVLVTLTSYVFWAWFMFCRFVLDWDISREWGSYLYHVQFMVVFITLSYSLPACVFRHSLWVLLSAWGSCFLLTTCFKGWWQQFCAPSCNGVHCFSLGLLFALALVPFGLSFFSCWVWFLVVLPFSSPCGVVLGMSLFQHLYVFFF